MDLEDELPKRADDPLRLLLAQDLDRLSVHDLEVRIVALEGEISRVRSKLQAAVNHKASAEALFRK